jgi:hypothetical protein
VFTEESVRVERVTCKKLPADLAELAAAISPDAGWVFYGQAPV